MYVLVGKQIMDFVGKDGNPVQGVKLHYTDDTRTDVEGLAASTLFIRKDHVCYNSALSLPMGEMKIEFGFGGRIIDIQTKK